MNQMARQAHTCQAIIVHCIDFRFQEYINWWAEKNIKGGFDRLSIAGGVKNLEFVIEQIEISVKLHGTKEAYLINHEDCGAYGASGTFAKHKEDLLLAKKTIEERFPKLKITLLYLKLNGEIDIVI